MSWFGLKIKNRNILTAYVQDRIYLKTPISEGSEVQYRTTWTSAKLKSPQMLVLVYNCLQLSILKLLLVPQGKPVPAPGCKACFFLIEEILTRTQIVFT